MSRQHLLTFSELDDWDKVVAGYPDESTQQQRERNRLSEYRAMLKEGKEVMVDEIS
jgi:hypothetical protein